MCIRVAGKMCMDGSPRKWEGTKAIELNKKRQVTVGTVRPEGDPNPALHFEWDGPADLSALVRTAWDEANLYLTVRVRCPGRPWNTPRDLGDARAADEGDCVELFLDFEEEPGRAYGQNTWRIFLVPPTADFPSISWHVQQPAAKELVGGARLGQGGGRGIPDGTQHTLGQLLAIQAGGGRSDRFRPGR